MSFDVSLTNAQSQPESISSAFPTPQLAHAGNDVPFVNNYGVWVDEFRDLGLEQNLDRVWEDALCYFGEGKEVRIGRQYGRVCRRRLRTHLLQRCQQNGVQFLAGFMHELETEQTSETATASIRLADGQVIRSRCVTAQTPACAETFRNRTFC